MIAWLLGCSPRPTEVWVTSALGGSWTGEVVYEAGVRPVHGTFVVNGPGAAGILWIEDPDEERAYELLEAHAVPPLGFSLSFLELTGVREATLGVIGELPPLDGYLETRVWCAEGQDGWCVEGGPVHLERR